MGRESLERPDGKFNPDAQPLVVMTEEVRLFSLLLPVVLPLFLKTFSGPVH